MVVVSHLFFFFAKSFRGRCDSYESHLPLFGTIYFPTAPIFHHFLAAPIIANALLHIETLRFSILKSSTGKERFVANQSVVADKSYP